jgi:hypothetical protein
MHFLPVRVMRNKMGKGHTEFCCIISLAGRTPFLKGEQLWMYCRKERLDPSQAIRKILEFFFPIDIAKSFFCCKKINMLNMLGE